MERSERGREQGGGGEENREEMGITFGLLKKEWYSTCTCTLVYRNMCSNVHCTCTFMC